MLICAGQRVGSHLRLKRVRQRSENTRRSSGTLTDRRWPGSVSEVPWPQVRRVDRFVRHRPVGAVFGTVG